MIQVRFKENEITVIGHANYAEYGKDIVCAAVSALVQTFVASVEELTTDSIKGIFSVVTGWMKSSMMHKENSMAGWNGAAY